MLLAPFQYPAILTRLPNANYYPWEQQPPAAQVGALSPLGSQQAASQQSLAAQQLHSQVSHEQDWVSQQQVPSSQQTSQLQSATFGPKF